MRAVDRKINPLILPYELIDRMRDEVKSTEDLFFLLYYYFNNSPVTAYRRACGRTTGQPSQEDRYNADILEQKYHQLITSLNQQMEIDPESFSLRTINRMAMQDRALAISNNRPATALDCTKYIADINGITAVVNSDNNDNNGVQVYLPDNGRDTVAPQIEFKEVEVINDN